MPRVPGGRHCGACQQVVIDLSAMTRAAARRFVAAHTGQPLCVRMLARPDGSLMFAPGPARAALAPALALGVAACTPWGPQQPESEAPDGVTALFEAPSIVVPPAPPDEPGLEAHDEGGEPVAAEPPGPDAGPSAVRYPRTPVPHPVHVPQTRASGDRERSGPAERDRSRQIMGALMW